MPSILPLIFAAVFIAVALFLLWIRARIAAETKLTQATDVVPAAQAAGMPPGSRTAVEGIIRCAAPLLGEFSQAPCVYFAVEVIDRWDEVTYDSENRASTESRSNTVMSQSRRTPFVIEDATGSVRVAPETAKVHAATSYSRRELIGNVTRTFEEKSLAVATAAYVLGVVQADGSIGGGSKQIFVIDNRPKAERIKGNRRWLFWLALFAAVLLLAAVVALIAAFHH